MSFKIDAGAKQPAKLIQFYLDQETAARLEVEASKAGISRSALIMQMINHCLLELEADEATS